MTIMAIITVAGKAQARASSSSSRAERASSRRCASGGGKRCLSAERWRPPRPARDQRHIDITESDMRHGAPAKEGERTGQLAGLGRLATRNSTQLSGLKGKRRVERLDAGNCGMRKETSSPAGNLEASQGGTGGLRCGPSLARKAPSFHPPPARPVALSSQIRNAYRGFLRLRFAKCALPPGPVGGPQCPAIPCS